jgi:hypothetical protein
MTVEQISPPRQEHVDEPPTSVTGVVDMVKTYALQETLGPLKGAGKWLAMGIAGSAALGAGLSLIVFGILRLIQAEWRYAADGALSWIPYLAALLVAVAFAAIAVSRINRDRLNKEPK